MVNEALENRRWRLLYRLLYVIIITMRQKQVTDKSIVSSTIAEVDMEINRDI